MIEQVGVLSKSPLFEGLSSSQLSALESCTEIRHFAPGDRLIEQGKRATHFFVIQTGKVSIEVYSRERGPQPIQQIGAGALVGSSSWVDPYKWQFDVRATEPTIAIAFDARAVQTRCDEDPELSAALLKRFFVALAQRLDAAQKQLLTLYATRP